MGVIVLAVVLNCIVCTFFNFPSLTYNTLLSPINTRQMFEYICS